MDKKNYSRCLSNTKVISADFGYPGGIKATRPEKILVGKFPERVLELAVKRMMPGGPLTRQQLTNLRIYQGSVHPHEAQNPEVLDVLSMNNKNLPRNLRSS